MKTSFKQLMTLVGTLVFGVLLFAIPRIVTAQGLPRLSDQPASIDLCTQIGNINTRIQAHLNDFGNRPDGQIPRLEDEATRQLNQKRLEWDRLRAQQYQSLQRRAHNDDQKQAVQTYQQTIESAVTKRRGEVDGAVTNFRTGLDGLVSGDKSSVDTVVQAYKDAINNALQKAQNSCNAGEDPGTIRTTLQADIRSARDNLKSSNTGIEKIRQDLEKLQHTRNSAIDAAIEEFQKTAHAAEQTLRQILEQ